MYIVVKRLKNNRTLCDDCGTDHETVFVVGEDVRAAYRYIDSVGADKYLWEVYAAQPLPLPPSKTMRIQSLELQLEHARAQE